MSVRSDIENELKAAELKEMLEKQQDEISQLRNILNDTQAETQQEIQKALNDDEHSPNEISNKSDSGL